MQNKCLLKKQTIAKTKVPISLVALVLLLLPLASFAQGANMNNPIIMGTYSAGNSSYTDSRDNTSYGNDYGQAGPDIFYRFVIQGSTQLTISTCSSSFDTYLHLLDVNGSLITSNDDYGPSCPSSQASISTTIPSGTYYIVAEGYYTYTGVINLTVNLTVQAPPVPPDSRNFVKTWNATAPETDPNTLMTRALSDVKHSASYFDGLGRPEQTIVKKGSLSSSGNTDLVSPVVYDAFGREVQKYLPYVSPSSDGMYKTNPLTEQNAFYAGTSSPIAGQGESYFYSKTVFEASPLNRVLESFEPGINWAGTSGQSTESSRNSVKAKYYVNTVTDSVRIWNVTDVANDFGTYATPSTDGTYAAGLLYKNITVDEMGKQVIEFKDKQGQVILKKVQLTGAPDNNGTGQGHTGWLCTYYIYDDLNQLRAVIQPNAVQALVGSWTLTTPQLEELCFRYEYDKRGRMIMKKVPGAGPVWMVYDRWDRLVLTQDGNQRPLHNWNYIKYDIMNRPIITGLHHDPGNITLALINAHLEEAQTWQIRYESENATTTGYTLIQTYPYQVESSVLTATHYDNYTWTNNIPLAVRSFDNSFSFPNGSNTVYPYPQSVAVNYSTQGMVTGSLTRVLGAGLLASVNFYDDKGRLIQNKSENITSGCDITTTQYSFSGQPLQTVQKQEKLGANAQTTVVVTQNTYDDLGRISKVEKKLSNTNVNGNAMSPLKTVLQNEYDALGQLKKKKVGTKPAASTELAKMDYEYNIRGWLLSINKTYTGGTNTDQYFAMELGYDKNPSLGTFTAAQYNGNIAGTVWRSAGDGVQRKYDFNYDAVNRLTAATFNQYVSGSGAGATFNTSAGLDFSVSNLTYDANGNIKTQSQKGWKISGSDYIDQLAYNYMVNSNKLLNVIDASNETGTKLGDFRSSAAYMTALGTKTSAATDYTYDANGNLKKDLNKDIGTTAADGITYNHLNLPSTITVTGKGSIEYIYDAAGNKVKKVVHETNKPDKTTVYIGGFVYEDDELKFLSHEEGRIRYEKSVTTCTSLPNRFIYDYFMKDHLGNVRMVVTEQNEPVCYIAATSEDSRLTNEQKIYDIVSTRRKTLSEANIPSSYTQFESKVYETNGSDAAKRIGLGAIIKVMSGDNVSLTCQSYYNMPSSGRTDNNYMAITDLLGALVNSGGVAAKGAMTSNEVYNYSTNATNLGPFLQSTPQPYTANAYLNWIIFDEQMKYVAGGADPVKDNGGYKLHVPSTIPITKNGFLYVYASNESNYPVYFDNLNITHIPGPIVEETHYYPFGLTMSGISSRAAGGIQNRNKFNGGNELQKAEFSDGTGMELYDATNRMYDPQLGRFWQVDELAESNWEWTPYAFAINNPILLNDPLGLDPEISTPDKPKKLENVTVVGVKGGLWAKTRLYYSLMDQTGGNLNRIVNNTLREQMYRIDAIVTHRERVAEMTRESDKIALEAGSFFIPMGWIAKIRYLKYASYLFKTKRGLVFWSGGKEVAGATAKAYGKLFGEKTLEMTLKGKYLEILTKVKGYEAVKPLWEKASMEFAREANGTVHIFQNAADGVGLKSLFATKEYPILKSKEVEMIFHDVFK